MSYNRFLELLLRNKSGKLSASSPSRKTHYYYLAAASLALIALTAFFYFSDRKKIVSKDLVIATKMGSKSSVNLPDGSKVWLNAGSEISYGEDFGKSSRDVKLSGEAYFEVSPDANRPFLVHTDNFNIKVLGTAFNVRAYAADDESEATLMQGLIELSINNGDSRKIMLKPNEKLVFKKNERVKESALPVKPPYHPKPEITITGLQKSFKDSVVVETQWLYDCLAFQDDKLKDIALTMSRWYGVSVEIKDKSLEQKEFSGLFRDENVEQVMRALKLAGKFDYTINKNRITIFP